VSKWGIIFDQAFINTGGLMVHPTSCPDNIGKTCYSGDKLDLRKHGLFIASLILFVTASGFAQTNISAGNVSGSWTLANSPYHINGEITIPNDSTLTVEPGVEVVFAGHYKFNIQGRLLAVGTPQDTIRFTAENMETGWHGIRFMDTPSSNDTSKMFYCSFKYGMANTGSGYDKCGGAMMIKAFDKVLVSHCLFDSNMQSGEGFTPIIEAGPAIYVYHASPRITNSTFSHHTGSKGGAILCLASPKAIISNNVVTKNRGAWVGAIVTYGSGSPTISGNIIFDNFAGIAGGGISVEVDASPRIENNIIIHNQAPVAGGIVCWSNTNAVLVNNTIAYNIATNAGGGIGCAENSDPILVNNIIFGNIAPQSSQVNINDVKSDPHFLYCNIEGGKEGFSGIGAGANYDGLYVNNIDSDPLFRDTASVDYRLKDSSPCIGAGVDSVLVAGNWIHAPLFCYAGNARPSPAGSMPDIGACENLLPSPLVGVSQELTNPKEFILFQNYPNPFNPTTNIQFSIVNRQLTIVQVYDVLGREVTTLVHEVKGPGAYTVQFDASNLSNGAYFYRLHAGGFVSTKEMLVLK
jgi:hypothetical protein